MMLYNEERCHQALGNDTPSQVYQSGVGGGAMILEKYAAQDEPEATAAAIPMAPENTGQRRAAACEISTA